MYKAFLIKYAEIGVKGKNRDLFEEALVRQIKYALKRCEGEFRVRRTRGRIYIDVLSDDYDYEETIDNLKTVCGVSAICPMVQLEDEGFDKLCESAVSYMDEHYPDKNITFKVNARRVMETADIIDTWVYRVGLVERQYSLGTAVGLLRSIVGIILMLSANKIAQKVTDYRIF